MSSWRAEGTQKSFVRGHGVYRSGAISKATFDIKDQFRRRPALMANLNGL
jgi:hypothetical protein